MILYKSLPKDKAPHGHKFRVGKWYKIDGDIDICRKGFHASKNIINSMNYVPAEVLAKVEVRGKSIKQYDKQCWSEMKLIKTTKWTKKDSFSVSNHSWIIYSYMGSFTSDITLYLLVDKQKVNIFIDPFGPFKKPIF